MRSGDTASFNTAKYERTVREMRERSEGVHDKGREIYRRTGHMDPLVEVKGRTRVSRNSMTKDGEKAILTNGPALAVWAVFDGTGSMGHLAGMAHAALGELNAMLAGIRGRYNPQIATGVVQDVCDTHPPLQFSQFESDERIAEQIRLLIPDGGGGDSTEDYQLALIYALMSIQTDINNFYGLKGYGLIVGDEIGRDDIPNSSSFSDNDVSDFLGLKLQGKTTTKAVAKQLLTKWHLFYVHVATHGAGRDESTRWWDKKLGSGRTILVPDPDLLAEVQAGLIYVTETKQPDANGLYEFLSAGGSNKKITKVNASEIWSWFTEANVPFGAQVALPGYADLPKPGDIFTHYRHQWPEGHARYTENVIPEEPAASDPTSPAPKAGKTDWSRFG